MASDKEKKPWQLPWTTDQTAYTKMPKPNEFAYLPGVGPSAQQKNLETLGWMPPPGFVREKLNLTCPASGCGAIVGPFFAATAAASPAADSNLKATYDSRLDTKQRSANRHLSSRHWPAHQKICPVSVARGIAGIDRLIVLLTDCARLYWFASPGGRRSGRRRSVRGGSSRS